MEKSLMKSSLEELYNSIENSNTYKEYKQIEEILKKDKEIKKIINEIKKLEKEATFLEYNGDERYKEIDEEIKKKVAILESKSVYQEYLNKMDKFNDELAISSKMIEKYIEEKV